MIRIVAIAAALIFLGYLFFVLARFGQKVPALVLAGLLALFPLDLMIGVPVFGIFELGWGGIAEALAGAAILALMALTAWTGWSLGQGRRDG